jgi:hypothetical protein
MSMILSCWLNSPDVKHLILGCEKQVLAELARLGHSVSARPDATSDHAGTRARACRADQAAASSVMAPSHTLGH